LIKHDLDNGSYNPPLVLFNHYGNQAHAAHPVDKKNQIIIPAMPQEKRAKKRINKPLHAEFMDKAEKDWIKDATFTT